jgi:hypothetical protein
MTGLHLVKSYANLGMRLFASNSIGWVVSAVLWHWQRLQTASKCWSLRSCMRDAGRGMDGSMHQHERDPMATDDPFSFHLPRHRRPNSSPLTALASRWRTSGFCQLHESDELVSRSCKQRARLLYAWGLTWLAQGLFEQPGAGPSTSASEQGDGVGVKPQ